jgi:hypothetical protein
MKDADFKNLKHQIGTTNRIASTGESVATGYKPDITVKDSNGVLKFILESEQKTDRKAFLGDLLKAEMYSEQQNAAPVLIIVMQEQPNTTTKQIADHIKPYKQWLAQKFGGKLSLSAVYVLSDTQYEESINAKEILGAQAFNNRCLIV